MRDSTKREVEYWDRILKPLIGAKVVFAQGCPEEDEVWPAIEVETTDGKCYQVVASRDSEGNGPGWLYIDKVPEEK